MNIEKNMRKAEVFKKVEKELSKEGLHIVSKDEARPWGGFFVINETQSDHFIKTYFPGHTLEEFSGFSKLSPKILLVEPGKRLSWQYHHRRSELWRVIAGQAGVITSPTNEQGKVHNLKRGDEVELKQGERHRLTGLKQWGIVAEIWKHTDPANPSDEEDIVRVEDDFGR